MAAPPGSEAAAALARYQQALAQVAHDNQLRAGDHMKYVLSGLADPKSIDVLGEDMPTGTLPPGTFYDPSKALQTRIGQVQGMQNQIQGYGETGDPTQLGAEQARLQAEQTGLGAAQTSLTGLNGIGATRSQLEIEAAIEAAKHEADPYQAVMPLYTELQSLGNVSGDPTSMEQQAQALENPPMIEGHYIRNPDPAGAAAIRQQIKNIERAGAINGQLASLDPSGQAVGKLGEINSRLTGLGVERGNAITAEGQRTTYRNQLTAAGYDPTTLNQETLSKLLGANSAAQAPLGSQIKNAQAKADTSNTLHNLLGHKVAGFAKGGEVVTIGAGKKLPGFAKGGSMVTDEPIEGIGVLTGRKKFIVGEPNRPGGPPMAERLTQPQPGKLKIKPLHRPAVLPGFARRAA